MKMLFVVFLVVIAILCAFIAPAFVVLCDDQIFATNAYMTFCAAEKVAISAAACIMGAGWIRAIFFCHFAICFNALLDELLFDPCAIQWNEYLFGFFVVAYLVFALKKLHATRPK